MQIRNRMEVSGKRADGKTAKVQTSTTGALDHIAS